MAQSKHLLEQWRGLIVCLQSWEIQTLFALKLGQTIWDNKITVVKLRLVKIQ